MNKSTKTKNINKNRIKNKSKNNKIIRKKNNKAYLVKNKSTKTSFAAFIIIGVEIPDEKHLLSKLIEGKILGFAFWKLRLLRRLIFKLDVLKKLFLLLYKVLEIGIFISVLYKTIFIKPFLNLIIE